MTMINTTEDLLRALDENPAFYEAVRSRIFSDALLQLPAKFDAFQQEMTGFVGEQRAFNEEVTGFVNRQETFNEEITGFVGEQRAFNEEITGFVGEQRAFNEEQRVINANLNARQDRMEGDISTLKAFFARTETVQNVADICEGLGLEYVATVSRGELRAMAGGHLPRPEFISFIQADLVISATVAGEPCYLAMEISFTGAPRDLERATRNAELLTRFTGVKAIPSVASVRNDRLIQPAIDRGDLLWYPLKSRDPETE